MFANPLWSLLLLAFPLALYFLVIRPRLKKNFTDLYAHLDSFWDRAKARVWAFRTPIVAVIGPVLAALPDLLVTVSSLDLSFLPQPWAGYTMGGSTIAVAIMKAFETTPRELPPVA